MVPLAPNACTNSVMRTPGSPNEPSVVTSVASGLTSSPACGPHECSICGHSWPAPGPVPAAGAHSTVYGVAGATSAPTVIREGSVLSALIWATNWLTGVSKPVEVSFDSQSTRPSVGGFVPWASDGGLSGGMISLLGSAPFGSRQRWPNWLHR